MTTMDELQRLYYAGLRLLPNDPDRKYPRVTGWQSTIFSLSTLRKHVARGGAIGLLMGVGGLEAVDLDAKHWDGDADDLVRLFEDVVESSVPGLLNRLVIQRTRSGGRHYIYRCSEVSGNCKLAERLPTDKERAADPTIRSLTLLETRGVGGQIMIAPSWGYEIVRGDLAAIPEITPDERNALHDAARAFHCIPAKQSNLDRIHETTRTDERPGDVFNRNGGADESLRLLEAAGWQVVAKRGSGLYLRRPGKRVGVSATFGVVSPGTFYCFTSNGAPFEPNCSYSPFAVYALLKHCGDYRAAARAISRSSCSAPSPRGPSAVPPPSMTENDNHPITPPARTVSERLLAALTDLGYSFRLNLLDDTVEVNGNAIDDVMRARIRTELRDRDVRPLAAVEDVYMVEAARNAYHPIRDYLDSLMWDGIQRIPRLAEHLTCDDEPVTYADGTQLSLINVYLGRWLIGAVAKVYEHAQNLMLVLVGPQGIGKSAFARWLCPLPRYYIEAPINTSDKDCDRRLITRWIWEVAELDATTRKADVAALKDFITRQTVTVRKPYGHHDITKPALASLIGTVNDGIGFLADVTGNRRFLVATITAIDWNYTNLDRDQLWAEAVHLYRTGASWQLLPNELQRQNQTNRHHEVGDVLDGWLEKHFLFDVEHDTKGMTTADILDHLRMRDVPINADRGWETRIGNALRRRGLTSKMVRRGSTLSRRYFGIACK